MIIGKEEKFFFKCRVQSKKTSLLRRQLPKMTFFLTFSPIRKHIRWTIFFQEMKFKWLSYEKNSSKLFFSLKMSLRIYFLLDVNFALTFSKAYAQRSDHSNWNVERTTYPKHFFSKLLVLIKDSGEKIVSFRHHNSIVELLYLFGLTANRINYMTKINRKFHAFFPNLFMKQ